jgi:glycosyltransferase involved in cell wall biosynthesis
MVNSPAAHRTDDIRFEDTRRLRVLLVGNYLPDHQESMQRFAEAMLEGLSRQGVEVRLIRPEAVFGRLGASSQSGLGKWLGYIDKFVLFPRRLKREINAERRMASSGDDAADVVVHICDHSNALYTSELEDVAHVVTCHDLLAVRSALGEIAENPTRWSGQRLQAMILGGLNRARHVACVSAATERDLRRLSALRSGRVTVIANSLNYPYAPMGAAEARASLESCFLRSGVSGLSDAFVLHVGGNQWYKNRLGVLRIYARLLAGGGEVPPLLLVGEPLTAEMESFVRDRGLEEKVFRVQGCCSEELRAFYSLANALLFPSLAEGFGWPVVEAQACGCPVVCSSVSPFPEVSGGGACLCDPGDEQGFADAIQRLKDDAAFRRRTIAEGFANAEHFRPDAMISKYVDCYTTLARAANPERRDATCAALTV